jgi:GT2 family glycosyltransferase
MGEDLMKVSVLMPVYNGADVLDAAIKSILAQTLTDLELLIVNDGSTDTTLRVVHSFKDTRIRVIDLPTNQGLVNALNTGLAAARGEFLARMDHDDIAHPARLEKQIAAMTESGSVICGSAVQPFGSIGGHPIAYPLTDAEIRASLPVGSTFAHPAVTMRTEVCRRLGYSSATKHCEDYDLWWRLSKEGIMENLKEPMLSYRFHPDQISSKYHQLQLTGTAAVAANQLRLEGRYRHDQDLHCHSRALSYVPLASLEELEAIGNWLNWLRNSFDATGTEVTNQYHHVWRRVCSHQPHLGTGLWNSYKRFPPEGGGLKADTIVFAAAYGGIGANDKKIKLMRSIFRR